MEDGYYAGKNDFSDTGRDKKTFGDDHREFV